MVLRWDTAGKSPDLQQQKGNITSISCVQTSRFKRRLKSEYPHENNQTGQFFHTHDSIRIVRAQEIPSRDHTSRAVVLLQVFLFLVGKGKSVVYTVMYPAFLNKQARNLIGKQPVPARNVC